MLIPGIRTLFEGVSSREYYRRQKEFRNIRFNGCVHIIFPDFEGVIFYSDGDAVTALEESDRWISLGKDLIAPVENKAVTIDGKMSAIALSDSLLTLFSHNKVATMVETELGPYISIRSLIQNLKNEHSTCILKAGGQSSAGYIFVYRGTIIGASYSVAGERMFGDNAVKVMASSYAKGGIPAAIYFMEETIGMPESSATAPTAMPVKASSAATVSAIPVKAPSQEGFKTPVEKAQAVPDKKVPVIPQTSVPARSTASQGIIASHETKNHMAEASLSASKSSPELVVVTSISGLVKVGHRSRLNLLETLEEHNVAWVDRMTLKSLGLMDPAKVSIILPGGKECRVTLKEASIIKAETNAIILPLKLRKRLSIAPGCRVHIKG